VDSQRLARLFDIAIEIPHDDLKAWLDGLRGGDVALRGELEQLLRADARASAFLEAPPPLVAEGLGAAAAPRQFGPYRVLRSIGAGGMGEVWLAERSDGEFEQRVAVKQLAWPTPGLLQRFRQERQILARLEHPCIARLIDGGVDAAGVPYLVMEYVEGVPITDFARAQALDVRACLRLFLRVCDAVQYAHQNLVVHRDLKPSNIFVTADGTPKLLDFGIAKVLAATDALAATQTLARLLTPDYAAPEQFAGGPITTATDVYALGIVLYELLAGARPHRPGSTAGARSRDPTHALDPRPPSATLDRTTGDAAVRRRALRGDLDRIVLTALAAEPQRRYVSAEALAADIRRYLDGRPISVRRDNTMYRLRKFVRRNPWPLAAAAVVLVVCVAATAVSLRQARLAHEQAVRAEQQAARAEEVRRFLVGVFEQAAPDENRGKPITAQQLLAVGANQLAANPRGDVALHAELTGLIGDLYWDLGDYASAEPLLRKAVALNANAAVPARVKARNLQRLAQTEQQKNAFEAAIAHAGQALAFAHEAGHDGIDEVSAVRRVIAEARIGMGNAKDAEPLLQEALAADRTQYGERSQAVADDQLLLGGAFKELSRYDEAVRASRAAIETDTALHGRLHSSVVDGLEALASAQGHRGEYAESEHTLREAVSIAGQIFGAQHRETIVARSNLFWTLEMQGRYAEALQGRMQLLEVEKALADTRPEQLAYAWNFLSSDYIGLGRFADAETAARKSLDIWRRIQGPAIQWDGADAMHNLGVAQQLRGHYAEAEATLREVIAIQARHEPPGSEWLNRTRGNLGNVQRLAHHPAEAVAVIRDALAALAPPGAKASPIRIYLQAQLAEAELDAGHAAAADATATAALAAARTTFPAGNVRIGSALFAAGRARLALRRAGDAEPLLREALAVRRPPLVDGDPRVLEVEVALVNALAALGKSAEAETLAARIRPLLKASATPYAADLGARLAAR
jgi:serine/threonine-protein kinase